MDIDCILSSSTSGFPYQVKAKAMEMKDQVGTYEIWQMKDDPRKLLLLGPIRKSQGTGNEGFWLPQIYQIYFFISQKMKQREQLNLLL